MPSHLRNPTSAQFVGNVDEDEDFVCVPVMIHKSDIAVLADQKGKLVRHAALGGAVARFHSFAGTCSRKPDGSFDGMVYEGRLRFEVVNERMITPSDLILESLPGLNGSAQKAGRPAEPSPASNAPKLMRPSLPRAEAKAES